MRNIIIAGNWKMNCENSEAFELFNSIAIPLGRKLKIMVFPPSVYLKSFVDLKKTHIQTGAQNCSQYVSGAYTGEISSDILKSIGINTVLIGHSERREYFNESNEILKLKVDIALNSGIQIVFCCGEILSIRNEGNHKIYVLHQLESSLGHLDAQQMKNIAIAYEPVWAIGTGVTATSDQAQEMHQSIREFVNDKWGQEIASNIHILYGGSMKSSNVQELLQRPDIDGGLIGGASLVKDEFNMIIKIASEI